MPKKIRELKSMLAKAGFTHEPAKGSHSKWTHAKLGYSVVLSGNDGSDAKRYQEKDVIEAIKAVEDSK